MSKKTNCRVFIFFSTRLYLLQHQIHYHISYRYIPPGHPVHIDEYIDHNTFYTAMACNTWQPNLKLTITKSREQKHGFDRPVSTHLALAEKLGHSVPGNKEGFGWPQFGFCAEETHSPNLRLIYDYTPASSVQTQHTLQNLRLIYDYAPSRFCADPSKMMTISKPLTIISATALK